MTASPEPIPHPRSTRRSTRASAPLSTNDAAGPALPIEIATDRRRRSLGRIADLESQVRPDWWRAIFDELYLKTDGDVFENDGNTRAEVDALVVAAELKHSDRILDLCCGQGRHAIELARRGFANITGIDQSRYLLELARERARTSGLELRFLEGDARRGVALAGGFDCVTILGNSFGYFQRPKDDAALLRQARLALNTGGRLVLELVDGEWLGEHFEPRSWEWVEDHLLVCRERALSRDRSRLITREIVLNSDRGVVCDRFFGERLYSPAQIRALLKSVGFHSIDFTDRAEIASSTGARSRHDGPLRFDCCTRGRYAARGVWAKKVRRPGRARRPASP